MSGDSWRELGDAPYDVPVDIEIEGGAVILATLCRDASMTEDDRTSDQWQAATERYPPCWSEGACWERNADGIMSLQPIRWRPALSAASPRRERGQGAP